MWPVDESIGIDTQPPGDHRVVGPGPDVIIERLRFIGGPVGVVAELADVEEGGLEAVG